MVSSFNSSPAFQQTNALQVIGFPVVSDIVFRGQDAECQHKLEGFGLYDDLD